MQIYAQSYGKHFPFLYGGIFIPEEKRNYITNDIKMYSCDFLYPEDMEVDIGLLYNKNKATNQKNYVVIQSILFFEIYEGNDIILNNHDDMPSLSITQYDILPPLSTKQDDILPPLLTKQDDILPSFIYLAPNDSITISYIPNGSREFPFINMLELLSKNVSVIVLLSGKHVYNCIDINKSISITGESDSVELVCDTINIKNTEKPHLYKNQIVFSNLFINIANSIIAESISYYTLLFESCYICGQILAQRTEMSLCTRIKNCYINGSITLNNGFLEMLNTNIKAHDGNLCIYINAPGQISILSNCIFESDYEGALLLININSDGNFIQNFKHINPIIKYCVFNFNKYYLNCKRYAINSAIDLYIENSRFFLAGGKYAINMNNNTLSGQNNKVFIGDINDMSISLIEK